MIYGNCLVWGNAISQVAADLPPQLHKSGYVFGFKLHNKDTIRSNDIEKQ